MRSRRERASLRGLLWLLGHALRPRRGRWASALALVLGTTILTMATLGALAVGKVVQEHAQQELAIRPVVDELAQPEPGSLRSLAMGQSAAERWNGHQIFRDYYSGGSAKTPIPGVDGPPGVAEYYASAALRSLIRSDPEVAALFEGLALVGSVESSGLRDPAELRAVIGTEIPAGFRAAKVEGFGTPGEAGGDDRVLNASVGALCATLVGLPAGVFLVMISRLRSRERRHRLHLLRGIGVSHGWLRALAAAEGAATALPAVIVGVLMFDLLIASATSFPGLSLAFFEGQAAVAWPAQVVVGASIVAFVAATSALGPRRAGAAQESVSRIEKIGVWCLAVAGGYLVGLALLVRLLGPWAALGIWVGCAAIAIGLALAGTWLVRVIAGLAARHAVRPSLLVGARVAAGSAASARIGSLAAVVIVVMMGGSAFASMLNDGPGETWEESIEGLAHVPIVVTDIYGGLDRAEVAEVAGTMPFVQQADASIGDEFVQVIFGTCRDLADLVGDEVTECGPGPRWLNRSPDWAARHQGALELPDGHRLTMPAPDEVVKAPAFDSDLGGPLLLLSPRLAPAAAGVTYLLATGPEAARTMALLSAQSPGLQFDLVGHLDAGPRVGEHHAQIEWLQAGALIGLVFAVLALFASALGETAERTARLRGLRVLGAPPASIAGAHLVATVLPVVTIGVAGSVIGWQMTRAMLVFDDRVDVPVATALWSIVGTALVALSIGIATLPDAFRSIRGRGGIDV